MHVEQHGTQEGLERLKFLAWIPQGDQRGIASATVDVFPPDQEHVDVRRTLAKTRGNLTMAGHLFKTQEGTWTAQLGSESLQRTEILFHGKKGSVAIINHWLQELVLPAINETLN